MTAKKPASKSQKKRLAAQKSFSNEVVHVPKEAFDALTARIKVLEANQKLLIESFAFAANELRPIYGLGGIAVVFDAVAKKFAK